jgi:LPXTG-motif cell wall-anchored protein
VFPTLTLAPYLLFVATPTPIPAAALPTTGSPSLVWLIAGLGLVLVLIVARLLRRSAT